MIELNRDQNRAELVRYDAATGKKEGVIYEEEHPKYVEPMHGLLFLPWDSSKLFIKVNGTVTTISICSTCPNRRLHNDIRHFRAARAKSMSKSPR